MKQSTGIFVLSGFFLLLSACGGGGGSSGGSAPLPFTLLSSLYYQLSTGMYSATGSDDQTQLTADFSSNDQIHSFSVSPDNRWLAIFARLDGDVQNNLYIMPASGGTASKVSTLSNSFSNVISFIWSPNSDHIVYSADDSIDGSFELFMVTINNDDTFSMDQKVSGPIGSNNTIGKAVWSNDSSHLAYSVSDFTPTFRTIGINTHEVGTQTGDTNFSVRVSKPVVDDNGVRFAWHPDENKLAYLSAIRSTISEIFWVNASEDSGSYQADNRVVSVLSGSAEVAGFKWSDDGRYIAYFVSDMGDHSLKIYDDDAGIVNGLLLLDNMNLGGTSDGTNSYSWIPGLNRIAGFHATATAHQLTTIDADGSSRVDILTTDKFLTFIIADDGSRIAIVDGDIPGLESRLFVVAVDSPAVEYSYDFTVDRIPLGASQASWSPDNTQFVYVAQNNSAGTSQVQRIDITDGNQQMISESGENARKPRWSPDGMHICHSRLTDLAGNLRERDLICSTSSGDNRLIFTMDDVETFTLRFTFDSTTPQSDST